MLIVYFVLRLYFKREIKNNNFNIYVNTIKKIKNARKITTNLKEILV